MSFQVNYEDDFFYLASVMKTIRGAIKLHPDPEFVAEKLARDCFFVGQTLVALRERLDGQSLMNARTQYLRALVRTQRMYTDCLLQLKSETENPLVEAVTEFMGNKTEQLLTQHQALLRSTQDRLDELLSNHTEDEAISEAEYRVLLNPHDRDDESSEDSEDDEENRRNRYTN